MTEIIPSRFVFGVELDDGWTAVRGTDLEDTFDNRVPCGEGQFAVPKFIDAVRRVGFDGPWGIEHMSQEFRKLPVAEALSRARDGAAVLRGRRPGGREWGRQLISSALPSPSVCGGEVKMMGIPY